MKRSPYKNKNIDLKIFYERIKEYFVTGGYRVEEVELKEDYYRTIFSKDNKNTEISLVGSPEDFTLTVKSEKEIWKKLQKMMEFVPLAEGYIRLKTDLLPKRYENKGMTRIDGRIRKILNIEKGDLIEIVGNEKTSAFAHFAYRNDVGKNLIRVDRNILSDLGVELGGDVIVRKCG
ncbi:MAG: hypothetical protein B5M53_00715 [Candidatus Cloacimonas sp. 4484_209]|nr:MAG: hypothetical protein B5M53_00715 [Candidatus Cloacimonas sp. 4484_209]